jgi:hypothetical protein
METLKVFKHFPLTRSIFPEALSLFSQRPSGQRRHRALAPCFRWPSVETDGRSTAEQPNPSMMNLNNPHHYEYIKCNHQ